MLVCALVAAVVVESAPAWERGQCGPDDIISVYGAAIDSSNLATVLNEYPRPLMTRGNAGCSPQKTLFASFVTRF